MIDAYSIFRGRKRIKWWDIYNYRAIDWNYNGLYEYVKDRRPTFIDATTDPFPEKELVSLVTEHQLHDIAPILVPDFELAQRYRHLNFLFYPLWLVSAIQKQRTDPCQIVEQRNKKLSCLNRQPRLHRFLTYYELSKQPWFDEVFISFAGLNDLLGGSGDVETITQLYALGTNVKEYFTMHLTDFPRTSELNYDWENCHNPGSPAYTSCWANLATETSVHTFCVTEKTTKPLTSGSLLFPVSSQGFLKGLEAMGFDLNFKGINYAFDHEPRWTDRVKQCVDEINRVYNNLPDIWATNRSCLQHNNEHFLSDQLLEYCLQDIKDYV